MNQTDWRTEKQKRRDEERDKERQRQEDERKRLGLDEESNKKKAQEEWRKERTFEITNEEARLVNEAIRQHNEAVEWLDNKVEGWLTSGMRRQARKNLAEKVAGIMEIGDEGDLYHGETYEHAGERVLDGLNRGWVTVKG